MKLKILQITKIRFITKYIKFMENKRFGDRRLLDLVRKQQQLVLYCLLQWVGRVL